MPRDDSSIPEDLGQANIVSLRAHNERGGFQPALRAWRQFAHRRGLVVASPTRLVGAERTFFGDSEDEGFGPKDYKLISADLLFADLPLSKNEKALLEDIAEELIEMSEVDISQCKAPSREHVPEHEDERGRWEVEVSDKHRVGTVVRVGEGAKKHYLLYLWNGGWYRVTGQPCFDLPLFGLQGLRERPEAPVMIHEGPKARDGALSASDGRFSSGALANWMSLYVHVAWHGADAGMEWTDWSPLRGRRVLIWPDMDEVGISYAIQLAKKLSRMGMVVDYVQWGLGDMFDNPSWDWGDGVPVGRLADLTRTAVRRRIQRIECPFDPRGNVSPEWERRSFLDAARGELYQLGDGYKPVPISAVAKPYGKGAENKILLSSVRPYQGRTFDPGQPFGVGDDGRINMCPPHKSEPIAAAPLEDFREFNRRWLRRMVPDLNQRKHLIRKAAVAVARPEWLSRHMIVMQGESGIGKSVFLDTLVNVAGRDRAASLFPDSILGSFNHEIANKTVVCIHEIHSDDLTRKQNAGRLKELIANENITIKEKYRPDETRPNVIHWFAATNERIPFTLDSGNDRFYFVRCASPPDDRARRKMERFFTKWVPESRTPAMLDALYAAAKHVCEQMSPKVRADVTGRAKRQRVWQTLERLSMRNWEQFMHKELTDIYTEKVGEDQIVAFYAGDLIRLVMREYPRLGYYEVEQRLFQFGYRAMRGRKGHTVRPRKDNLGREAVWAANSDIVAQQARGGRFSYVVRRFHLINAET